MDDPQHPRAHASALALVSDSASPHGEKCFLRDVLGYRSVPHHPVCERECRASMPVVDQLEGPCIPVPHEVHELLVRESVKVLGLGHVPGVPCSGVKSNARPLFQGEPPAWITTLAPGRGGWRPSRRRASSATSRVPRRSALIP